MFDLLPINNRDKSIWNYFDNLEKSFFQNAFSSASVPRTDIVDEGDRYVLSAELPGFAREDIQIDVDNGTLTIRAEHNTEEKEKKDNYIRRERRYGSFSRSFDLSGINADNIAACYENGVLSLNLPKLDAQPLPPARRIEIQ